MLGGNYMNWQFHCSCRNTSDMYQSCYKRFAGMQCIRVTSLKNVTLQTRRDNDDFNFADRNDFGRLTVQLIGSVILNNNNFLFAYVFSCPNSSIGDLVTHSLSDSSFDSMTTMTTSAYNSLCTMHSLQSKCTCDLFGHPLGLNL